jgi:protein-tyrosine phosphatase
MPAEAPFTLLIVCTGNICRSAVAERLAVAHLADVQVDPAVDFRIMSAGVHGLIGSPMDPASARALVELGGDPAGFRATRLTDRLAVDADLTLTMTRAHRAEVLHLAPRAMNRTFTLREASGLLDLLDPEAPLPDHPLERARAVVTLMATVRSRRRGGPGDDIADPIGQDDQVHRSTAYAIAEALTPVLDRVIGTRSAQPAGRSIACVARVR